jgi:hypothetical protein
MRWRKTPAMAAGLGFGVVVQEAMALPDVSFTRLSGFENSGRLAGLGAGIIAGAPLGAIGGLTGALGGGFCSALLSLSSPEVFLVALLAPVLAL